MIHYNRADGLRIAAGGALDFALLGFAALNPTGPTGASKSSTSTTAAADHTTIPTLPSPAAIGIPLELAQSIGQARANTEPTCTAQGKGRAISWAEIDEGGNVQGISSACVEGP